MHSIRLFNGQRESGRILCLGAHSDDIEIGCGGTLLRLLEEYPQLEVTWVVFSGKAAAQRERESIESADAFLQTARKNVILRGFRDGFLPFMGGEVKEYFEELKKTISPDVIFTHCRSDLHQDHQLISELTWNTFRDHLILEYEVPKYDGGLGSPNFFVPLSESICKRKVRYLLEFFGTQKGKQWFTSDTFFSMLRIRGLECNSPSHYAEAFYSQKVVM